MTIRRMPGLVDLERHAFERAFLGLPLTASEKAALDLSSDKMDRVDDQMELKIVGIIGDLAASKVAVFPNQRAAQKYAHALAHKAVY